MAVRKEGRRVPPRHLLTVADTKCHIHNPKPQDSIFLRPRRSSSPVGWTLELQMSGKCCHLPSQRRTTDGRRRCDCGLGSRSPEPTGFASAAPNIWSPPLTPPLFSWQWSLHRPSPNSNSQIISIFPPGSWLMSNLQKYFLWNATRISGRECRQAEWFSEVCGGKLAFEPLDGRRLRLECCLLPHRRVGRLPCGWAHLCRNCPDSWWLACRLGPVERPHKPAWPSRT